MTTTKRWTRALPIAIIAAGVLIPVLVGRDTPEPAVAGESAATYAGRTVDEWEQMADRAMRSEAYGRALSCFKSAERAAPGTQFADEITEVRRARWRARRVASLRDRFLGGRPEHVQYDSDGRVATAHRTTLALPGESLWTLAVAAASAETGVLPEDGPSERLVYRWWDALTEMNGLRELEVGEAVRLPVLPGERVALERAVAGDMKRIARGLDHIGRGDVAAAQAARDSVRGDFARHSGQYAALGEELALAARRERLERERSLVLRAQELAAGADTLSRAREYEQYVATLSDARDALREAELLSDGEQYTVPAQSVERLIEEARRVRVEDGGIVVARREAGESYTEAALDAVEWLLERQLERSGAQFPDVGEKTPDQIAWARFMVAASELAEARDIELAAVLASSEGGEIVLPHPADYFTR